MTWSPEEKIALYQSHIDRDEAVLARKQDGSKPWRTLTARIARRRAKITWHRREMLRRAEEEQFRQEAEELG